MHTLDQELAFFDKMATAPGIKLNPTKCTMWGPGTEALVMVPPMDVFGGV